MRLHNQFLTTADLPCLTLISQIGSEVDNDHARCQKAKDHIATGGALRMGIRQKEIVLRAFSFSQKSSSLVDEWLDRQAALLLQGIAT